MKYIGLIADHPTPKPTTGGVSFTMASRDYKDPHVLVLSDARANATLSEDIAPTLLKQSENTKDVPIICLNDQGGAFMAVTSDATATLRAQMGGHPPSFYTIDEKMGQTYINEDLANTIAARDYKQPQCVIYRNDNLHRKAVL